MNIQEIREGDSKEQEDRSEWVKEDTYIFKVS